MFKLPKAFRIGIQPLAMQDWFCIDERLIPRVEEKRRLLKDPSVQVYASVPDMQEAEAEVLLIVTDWLQRYAAPTHVVENGVAVIRSEISRMSDAAINSNLQKAAMLLADDLVIMRSTEEGWQLAAGSVSFPSVWVLAEKIGKIISAVHESVPEFGQGTQADRLIGRMFDSLKVGQRVQRGNWSLHATDQLHLPRHASGQGGQLANTSLDELTLRMERQTLCKLAGCGDILFTIDTFIYPVASLSEQERDELDHQIDELDERQRRYRGLMGWGVGNSPGL
ncbi:MAG: DUF3445 domain-containing protein [Granulosicoccus sp.]